MINKDIKYIRSFLDANPRNKLIVCRKNMQGVGKVNLGKYLSSFIETKRNSCNLSMEVEEELKQLVSNCSFLDAELGICRILSNPGILFEPELKIDIPQFLSTCSKNEPLFLEWPGEIEGDNKLWFLSKRSGKMIDITQISHIILE